MSAVSTQKCWYRQLEQDGKSGFLEPESTVGYKGVSVMSSEKSCETEEKGA